MNPFGIIQAALLAIEGAARAVFRKPQQESRGEGVGFWILHWLFLVGGFGVIAWTVYDLYFRK
jgi:hypothetical protein